MAPDVRPEPFVFLGFAFRVMPRLIVAGFFDQRHA